MAKKNYKKFLPKVGSTVAVAMAMTVALSTQAQAAELDDAEILNGGLSMDEIEVNDKAMSAQIVPGSYNNEVEQSNDETIDENEETIENNDQTQQNNDAIAGKNEEDTEGFLTDPDLDMPDAPEMPNTDGMDAEDYNEAVGDYNEKVDDYNKAVGDYNEKVDDYNSDADIYDQLEQEKYEEDLKDYEQKESEHQTKEEAYAEYEKALAEHQAEVERLTKEYEEKLAAFEQAEADHEAKAEAYAEYEKALAEHEAEVERLTKEYNEKLAAFEKAEADHDAKTEAYEAYQKALAEHQAEVERLTKEYEEKLAAFEKAEADHAAKEQAYAEYQKALAEHEAEVERLTKEYEEKLAAFEKAEADHAAKEEAYAAYEKALADHQAEVERLTGEHEKLMNEYNKRAEEHAKQAQEYSDYLKAKAIYDEAVKEYEEKMKLYEEDFEEYLKQYVEENGESDAEYQKYLEAKAAYEAELAIFNAYMQELGIFEDVSDYNQQIADKNSDIADLNAALDKDVDAGTADNIGEVSKNNENVQVSQDVLNVLGSYDELTAQHQALQDEAAALEAHAGKNADLGSDAYAAYLAAVEAYNEKVTDFNANVEAYNAAVEAYNDAVDTYNKTQENLPNDSTTGNGYATGEADWGNIQITQKDRWGNETNKTLNHIHVKYDAAASKDVDSNGNYSENVTGYDVTGVYANEHKAQTNPNSYGVTYDNDGPTGSSKPAEENMYKDAANNEFGANTFGGSVRIDPVKGTVSFYVTLEDDEGNTHDINVDLNSGSTYAEGSYYKAETSIDRRTGEIIFTDTLGAYRDSNGQELERKQIDGEWYYNISGKSVYVISALTCEGTSASGSKINIGNISGLDLVLNLQTMIEIHQAENAEKINYVGFEMGKTAQIDAPDPVKDPGQFNDTLPEPIEPDPIDPVKDPGLFTEEAPELDLPEGPKPVENPGEFDETKPELDLPEGPKPVENPGDFTEKKPEAPQPAGRLEHLDILEQLKEKIIIEIDDIIDPIIPPVDPVDPVNPPVEPIDPPAVPTVVDGEIEIPDEEVPLAAAPKTGDISALWMALSGLSASGFFFLGRKRKDEEA